MAVSPHTMCCRDCSKIRRLLRTTPLLPNAKTYIKGDFDAGWRKALHDGWVEGTAFSPNKGAPGGATLPAAPAPVAGGIEIAFKP